MFGNTVDKKDYATEEVNDFSWFKKQELPVAAMFVNQPGQNEQTL
jgi:hypothetical protein